MSYSAIHGMRKEVIKESNKSFVENLIVGNDIFAVAQYLELEKNNTKNNIESTDNIMLISERDINYQDLFLKGPSTLRGEDNIKAFKEVFPEIELNEQYQNSLFLKEGELKEFGGRTKGEKLLWGEKFYSDKRVDVDLKKVFPFLEDQATVTRVNEKKLSRIITGIKKAETTDLIDRAHYAVTLSNGDEIQCENLYWSQGPSKFLELYSNKNELSDNFISFCETLKTPCTLHLEFEFDEPISDQKETLFIPLSYTHEWGHFIGEFQNIEGESSKQRASFLTFIDSDHNNEEDISRKIRLFKRNIEKIAPNFKKNLTEEYITLNDVSFCSKFDNAQSHAIAGEHKNLHFVGLNGTIEQKNIDRTSFEDSCNALSHLTRGLLSLRNY